MYVLTYVHVCLFGCLLCEYIYSTYSLLTCSEKLCYLEIAYYDMFVRTYVRGHLSNAGAQLKTVSISLLLFPHDFNLLSFHFARGNPFDDVRNAVDT